VLFSVNTPLLFMGEEVDEPAPFRFFTDHIDPLIANATREGRKREFAAFTSFSGEVIPDPQSVETFEASKLTGGTIDPLYVDLLRLRRELPRRLHVEVDGRRLLMRRGEAVLVADFEERTVELRR
jgi:maltooligosyltrehalose trehalohydrolase